MTQETPEFAPPQPRLKPIVWVVGALVIALVGVGLWQLPTLLGWVVQVLPLPPLPSFSDDATPQAPLQLPDTFTHKADTYGVPAKPGSTGSGRGSPLGQPGMPTPGAQPPTAEYLVRGITPPKAPATPDVTAQLVAQQGAMLAGLLDIKDLLKAQQQGKAPGSDAGGPAPGNVAGMAQGQGVTGAGASQGKKGAKKIAYLAVPDQAQAQQKPSEAQQKDLARVGEAQDLIKPAKWAIPVMPLRTIYRSMRMTGKLLDSINTDIEASTIRIELTEDLVDKFHYGQVILPATTIVVSHQVGKAEFGQQRVPLKIDQFEPPTGEVIKVDGSIGDKDGAAGVPGKVNAHIPQLLLAAGVNAVMQLGLGYAGGTPGRGQYYQDPAQKAIQDAGQSVAQDVNSYSRQVLKRPPTIEVDASAKAKHIPIVTIALTENIQLNRAPIVAR